MSAASSNFPGLAGSRDMINGFNVFEARSKENEMINKWAREVLLGIVNAAGNEMKDGIFKPEKGGSVPLTYAKSKFGRTSSSEFAK